MLPLMSAEATTFVIPQMVDVTVGFKKGFVTFDVIGLD